MNCRSQRGQAGVWGTLAALALVACALAAPAGAAASPRLHPRPAGATASAGSELARIAAYWTPARMRGAVPLEGGGRADPLAVTSFVSVADATVAPYAVNGRIFIRQGGRSGYCSGTAINSASRRLVLTAGHCVNTGPRGRNGSNVWSRFLEFVPAYTDGTAPFGAYVAHRAQVFAPNAWIKQGSPNFDMGAALVKPIEGTVNLADAVGGVTIALNRSRKEEFQTFGYPGESSSLQRCDSPSVGDDKLTYAIPGPPTLKIRCHWLPGASGGGWLIGDGTEIDGLTSYGRSHDDVHTFGPYFSNRNIGPLVKGF